MPIISVLKHACWICDRLNDLGNFWNYLVDIRVYFSPLWGEAYDDGKGTLFLAILPTFTSKGFYRTDWSRVLHMNSLVGNNRKLFATKLIFNDFLKVKWCVQYCYLKSYFVLFSKSFIFVRTSTSPKKVQKLQREYRIIIMLKEGLKGHLI